MSPGVKIGLIVGGAVLVLSVMCCGVIGLVIYFNSGPSNQYSWSLRSGDSRTFTIPFKKGDKAEIIVESTKNSDMDIFVFKSRASADAFVKSNKGGMLPNDPDRIVYDIGDSSNCKVEFVAPETQDYYVVLVNTVRRDPSRDGKNSGKLIFNPAPGSK